MKGARPFSGVRRSIAGCSGSGADSFVGGTNNNVAAGLSSGVLSGLYNDACDGGSGIGVGSGNTINSSGFNITEFIGGGEYNGISAGDASFIGAGLGNTLSGPDAAIVGGEYNNAGGTDGFVGGGYHNVMNSGNNSVIGGGEYNGITGSNIVIGGGDLNAASTTYSAIVGGYKNTASGNSATVVGGAYNIASGTASFAAGDHADADFIGSFVWSDSSSTSATKATAGNQFVARAAGGVTFFTNSAMTTGVKVAPGSGTWASASDRNLKTDVAAIDDAGVLERVAALPITKWSYISEHGVRHVGPMAQDFYAAFGVGEDNKHITSIDEDGVALAAIKALHRENAGLRSALADTRRQLKQLAAEVATMRR